MLKKAVKLLRGSVCVRAKSAYPERMLNLCSARGIEFWDVNWLDAATLSFCVARGDLRALRRAAEGCGAEVSIERTAGTPFFFARLRRRHARHHALRPFVSLHCPHLPFGQSLCTRSARFACPTRGKFRRRDA